MISSGVLSRLGRVVPILLLLLCASWIHSAPDYTGVSPNLFPIFSDDENVDIFVSGSWQFELSGGVGFGYSQKDGFFGGVSQGGVTEGFGWNQTPDITLSVWLFDRLMLETFFSKRWEDNTFKASYIGKEGELLQRVTIGNSDQYIGRFAGVVASDSPYSGFGLSGRLATPRTEHEFLLRFDPTDNNTDLFVGSNRVEEYTIEPDSFIRGRYFILPDRGVSGVEILVEDYDGDRVAGDGRRYSIADPATYNLDAERGTVEFVEPLGGYTLIGYPGFSTTFSFTGSNSSQWGLSGAYSLPVVSVPSRGEGASEEYLVLWSPGRFTPLEVCRFYTTPVTLSDEESWKSVVSLVARSSPEGVGENLKWSGGEDGVIAVGSSEVEPQSILYSYPLLEVEPDGGIYGPNSAGGATPAVETRSAKIIRIQSLKPVEKYLLSKPLKNSVQVYVNGLREERYTINNSGQLSFDRVIHASDRIEITYQSSRSSELGGDLLFAWGSRFNPVSGLSLEVGTKLKWNFMNQGYTSRIDQSPGQLLLSLATSYRVGELDIDLITSASLNSPDTVGRFQIAGMQGEGMVVPVLPTGVYPASPSDRFSQSDRGILYSKNYLEYSVTGTAVIKDYKATLSSDSIYAYEEGSRVGPYVATASSDDRGGNILLIDGRMEGMEWVGAQLPLRDPDSSGRNLSGHRAINLAWRWSGEVPDSVDIAVEIGTLGEDLDGDGVLDKEGSTYDDGFIFNDSRRGISLKYGGGAPGVGNNFIDSEDANGNGVLDLETEFQVVSINISPTGANRAIYPTGEWSYIRIPLTPAQRSRLVSANAIKIILANRDSSPKETTLLVGDIFFEGSTLLPTRGDGLEVSETYEGQLPLSERPDSSLETEHPEVASNFASKNSSQKILRVAWDSPWEATGYFNPVFLSSYSTLSFYVRIPDDNSDDNSDRSIRLALGLLDEEGRGMRATVPFERSDKWRKVSIDYSKKTIQIDGVQVDEGEVSFTPPPRAVTQLTLAIDETEGGRLYLDEIHLDGSLLDLALTASTSIAYGFPNFQLVAGGFRFLAAPSIRVVGSIAGNTPVLGHAELSFRDLQGEGRGELNLVLLESRVQATVNAMSSGSSLGWGGDHTITIPSKRSWFSLVDSFSYLNRPWIQHFSRSNSLSLTPTPLFGMTISSSARYSNGDDTLNQVWSGTITSTVEELLSLKLQTDWGLTSGEWVWSPASYPESWWKGFALVVATSEGKPVQRRGSVSGKLALSQSWGSPKLDFDLGYFNNVGGVSTGHTFKTEGGLDFPFTVGESVDGWRISPSYRRTITTTSPSEADLFSEDLAHIGRLGESLAIAWNPLPFAELYMGKIGEDVVRAFDDAGLTRLKFSPKWSLSITRPVGSYISNLYLPVNLSVTQSRLMEKTVSRLSDSRVTEISLMFRALNLFGRLGVLPRFNFYRTEEITSIIGYTINEDLHAGKGIKHQLEIDNHIYFKGNSGDTVELNHNFSLDATPTVSWSDSLEITWIHRNDLPGFTLPKFFPRELFHEPSLRHDERLEIDLSEYGSSVGLKLQHQTSLEFSVGRIGAFITISINHTLQNQGSLFLVGLQGGLNGELSF